MLVKCTHCLPTLRVPVRGEVRLIADIGGHGLDHFRYPVDPKALIQEVVLDPRMEKARAATAKSAFAAAGLLSRVIQSGCIGYSGLCALPAGRSALLKHLQVHILGRCANPSVRAHNAGRGMLVGFPDRLATDTRLQTLQYCGT